MTLPPAADDPLLRLLAREVRQRAGEHERLARQRALAGRRALLLEAQARPRRSSISGAHRVVELAMDQLRDDRPDARRLGDLLRRRGQQRVDRAEAARRGCGR